MTILTLRIAPVVPILWYSVFCDVLGDPLANGPKVLEQWQNLVNAPPALSSTFSATAKPSASVSVHGWYRNEDNDPDAKRTLRCILDELWLDNLPNVKATVAIKQLPLLLSDKEPGNSTIEAATTGALLVPMPIFNQWKLKSAFTFRMVTAEELKGVFEYLKTGPSANPVTGVGYLNPWLMGGQSNSLPAAGAAIPVREDAVMWVHVGAQWNDEPLGQQALDWVDGLWASLDGVVSDTHFYGCPDLQLGSQLSDPPNLGYVEKYWKSPTHDFLPFLVEVKKKYDPEDVFKFAQSIPLPPKSDSVWDWL